MEVFSSFFTQNSHKKWEFWYDRNMKEKDFRKIELPYVSAQTLLYLFSDYAKPRERILRLVKNQELIRLKNGFYLIAEKIEKGIPYEQVANLLYGPSYVSFEWALSFYGMIPEKVYRITSATLSRKKEFQTPVGTFTYTPIPSRCYPVGITLMNVVDGIGGFLIATPEKALADLVFTTCRGFDAHVLSQELLESKRISGDLLKELDRPLLVEIAQSYRSKTVNGLIDMVNSL